MTELEFAQVALEKAQARYLSATDAKSTQLQQGGVSNRAHESHDLDQLRKDVDFWQKRVKTLQGQGQQLRVRVASFSRQRYGC